MEMLEKALKNNPITYVTRDIERALGLPLDTRGYFIISNSTPFGKSVYERFPESVLLIDEGRLLDTWELLEHPETVRRIRNQESGIRSNILVFKSTTRIEAICKKNDWNLLNPSAAQANQIEEKISQVEWLGDLAKFLPTHEIVLCKDVVWKDAPFILQFNRAHTGTGTMLITSLEQLEQLQHDFPDRPARVTQYISGPVFTSNNCVGQNKILMGNVSYQITGLSPFTDNPFATIGNDWKLPHALLSKEQQAEYGQIVQAVGEKMRKDGWKGLFGTDAIVDEKTGKVYLLEINARQPASTTYESQLQNKIQDTNNTIQMTTFEAHIMSLLDMNLDNCSLIVVEDGAQVIVRNKEQRTTSNEQGTTVIEELKKNFQVIEYTNTKAGTDLVRIQSKTSLMQTHGVFNEIGQKISQLIRN